MAIRIIRIILTGVILRYDRISRQVKKKPCIFPYNVFDLFIELVVLNDLTNHHVWSNHQAGTSDRLREFIRQFCIRKKLPVIRIRDHHRWIQITLLSYRRTLRDIVFFYSIISPTMLVINIGRPFDFFLRNARLAFRDQPCNSGTYGLLLSVNLTRNNYTISAIICKYKSLFYLFYKAFWRILFRLII